MKDLSQVPRLTWMDVVCHHFIIKFPLVPVSAPGVGNVAGVVSLPTPGAHGLTARVRDQGGGGGQRPGRVPPLGEDEEAATA